MSRKVSSAPAVARTTGPELGRAIYLDLLHKMLTVDACIAPDGSLVVACHSGAPDWGSGPTGKGKLFKITYSDPKYPQPVVVWPTGPREVRVEFDRAVPPELLRDVVAKTTLTGPVVDQAALHGLLNRVCDLGLVIVSVRRLDPE